MTGQQHCRKARPPLADEAIVIAPDLGRVKSRMRTDL